LPDPDADAASVPEDVPTANPLGSGFTFDLLLPKIQVRMVDAAALEEYEIWIVAASICAAATVGFVVAYLQSFHLALRVGQTIVQRQNGEPTFLVVAILFFALLLLSLVRILVLRNRITSRAKTYSMQAVSGDQAGGP
jgi:hypothetical protein